MAVRDIMSVNTKKNIMANKPFIGVSIPISEDIRQMIPGNKVSMTINTPAMSHRREYLSESIFFLRKMIIRTKYMSSAISIATCKVKLI